MYDSLKKVNRNSIKQEIYDQVKRSLFNNELPLDQFITEVELSNLLEVSRTPVREAINELVLEQLMIFKPRKGYKVNTFTNHEIDQIFLLRESLEIACVPFIVKVINTEHIKDLKKIVENQTKAAQSDDYYNFMLLDKNFHTYLMKIIQFELFLKSYNVQHDLSILIGTQGLKSQGRMMEVIAEHNVIIEALENKDEAKIVNAMKAHLEKSMTAFKVK
ncbi:GntR family transcriptional regulator [Staphylococcus arlettae]|uniref:GntR family transcriptional regulator n=1 Tax=Staphylococcus arlettae TaxID=29378 RepID=UPI000DCAFC91|nr:GntR family transcriptional regulator [Staphylococcus arlettae]MCP8714669.1 GntR family transcriptional regulator [Staphylococcus arlettae]MDN0187019.1 GntR family transcriptional regulator [Staphylococcus arlettae]RBA02083.1 putative HTH-type transcriptional regulator YdfH [Staphylococcus arlettae]RBA04585.1 putative HTH-type transcriptional regulator YdfH [Staphylococcus arlettae]RBA06891.1 putative HTH-type transcriptional regulator YdfH [Staphylococcus arlettae]